MQSGEKQSYREMIRKARRSLTELELMLDVRHPERVPREPSLHEIENVQRQLVSLKFYVEENW